jgi:eukaryotic-like serine/threonine-protein kinase
MAGEILGDRYLIERQLGKQAGRQTLLARDKDTQALVVIKLLTFSNDFEWDDLKLFEREAETLKSLSHPAIPRYLDYFELDTPAGKGFALVQSYIEAKSLEEYLSAGRTFSETDIKQLAKALLEILTYLHSQKPPVIHRDIKPHNILLANRSNSIGQVYLVDFGSVQTLATQEGRTVTVVGTYGYMPPEQFGGRAVPASDLYSLGATLIALLTRTHPADLPQKDMRIKFAQIAKVSPTFADWLKWMTEPNVERRLHSAQSALEALEQKKYRNNYSSKITSKRAVSTESLLFNSIWRSTAIGSLAVTAYAAIYGTFMFPGVGTLFGAILGGLLGAMLGFGNGILVGILTRLFFFPLTNSKLHRRVVTIASIIICTAVSIPYFHDFYASPYSSPSLNFRDSILWIIAPAVISGLSMGVSSKLIARWYERESKREE